MSEKHSWNTAIVGKDTCRISRTDLYYFIAIHYGATENVET